MTDTAIAFRKVSILREGVQILENVTASVPTGGCTAVVGPNGAGKTTLLMAMLGNIPFSGTVAIHPRPDGTPARIGYVPQRLTFDRGLPLTVVDLLVMARQRLPLWLGRHRHGVNQAMALLSAVHAESIAHRKLGVLSGGELQRVLLALALQRDPDLLILDEPAAGIDVPGGHVLCELMERLRREHGFTQLMVSHDLGTVSHHATHVIMLNRTVIAEGPPDTMLQPPMLAATFGIHMGIACASHHTASDRTRS
jgi:zinc transport system ATP-binding protein